MTPCLWQVLLQKQHLQEQWCLGVPPVESQWMAEARDVLPGVWRQQQLGAPLWVWRQQQLGAPLWDRGQQQLGAPLWDCLCQVVDLVVPQCARGGYWLRGSL